MSQTVNRTNLSLCTRGEESLAHAGQATITQHRPSQNLTLNAGTYLPSPRAIENYAPQGSQVEKETL